MMRLNIDVAKCRWARTKIAGHIFKLPLCSAVAVIMVLCGTGFSQAAPVTSGDMSVGLNHKTSPLLVQVASADQNANLRINDLEQKFRDLTGKIEELNFMVLQMQEQIRALQQAPQVANSQSAPASAPGTTSENGQQAGPGPKQRLTVGGQGLGQANNDEHERSRGAPPQQLGTVKFDSNGNIISQTPQNSPLFNEAGGPNVDLMKITDSKDLYDLGYQRILAGDYRGAEEILRSFQQRFPQDPLIADANYWLAEALYGQGRYRDAAEVYSALQRNYKDSPRAPETLLKLGMTMAKLDNDKVACAVFAEIAKRYKTLEPALVKRIKEEQSRNHCR